MDAHAIACAQKGTSQREANHVLGARRSGWRARKELDPLSAQEEEAQRERHRLWRRGPQQRPLAGVADRAADGVIGYADVGGMSERWSLALPIAGCRDVVPQMADLVQLRAQLSQQQRENGECR